MKNATVVIFVLFQLILNREWMTTALLQAKYLNSINEYNKQNLLPWFMLCASHLYKCIYPQWQSLKPKSLSNTKLLNTVLLLEIY